MSANLDNLATSWRDFNPQKHALGVNLLKIPYNIGKRSFGVREKNVKNAQANFSVSVIIPTRNRPEKMEKLLNALLSQTVYPKEIIIVDDSDREETKSLTHRIEPSFFRKSILLKYTRGKEKNGSISAARNIGFENANGDIILFFDDDVVPEENSIEQIIKCYQRHPDAKGVAGYYGLLLYPNIVFPNLRFSFLNAFKKVFLLSFMEKGKERVLPSGHITFPYMLTNDINCDWMSGGFSSYRAEVLRLFKFDEKLRAYSLWEDVDLSLRVNNKYPGFLFMTPFAKAVHEASPLGRRPPKLLNCMLVSYHVHFFFKNMPQSFFNRLAIAWSWLGTFLFRLSCRDLDGTILLLKAYCYTVKHLKEIINGQFSFLDQ